MGILKTIAKGICLAVAAIAGLMFAMFVILTICWGPFGGGADNGAHPVDVAQTPAPTATLEPIESSIEDFINVHKSGQDITVECKRLSVSGNNNAIQIGNSDVEKITILGHGNSIGYSCDADPQIIDHGDYNDVWQRWLT